MYKWKTLTYDFDKSKQIFKIRFNTDGSELPSSISQVGFFAESPNINCDGLNRTVVTGATYGYASENRFGVRDNIFGNHYYGFMDERWTAHTHTTAITSTISEFDCPIALYYAGATDYNDATFQTVLAEKVSVYVESDFELSTSAVTFSSEASSSTIMVTSSDNPWTATTNDSWITLSQSTGNTGETTITVSVSSSIFSDRTGTVSFTDGEETIYLTVNQKKNTSVRLRNIYLENTRIDKMYCNGDLIYQSLIKPVFSLSTDELIIETGQTGTFDITANDRWTITAPEWLTVSQNSGYGNATITVTMGSVDSAGTINVTCYNQTKSISVTTQIDYSKKYLMFNILNSGVIYWTGGYNRTIQYSKDKGVNWYSISSSSSPAISVNSGDVVMFKGNNNSYYNNSQFAGFSGSTAQFEAEGNVMSLIYGDNFINNNEFPNNSNDNFNSLFKYCTSLVSVDNLILPATTLADGCYQSMFNGCTSLTKAPALPATTLVSRCYRYMFQNSNKLKYVKSLATDISANLCTNYWVSNVSASGTFVKKSGITWPSGTSGIPSGWTVIEE